MKILGAMANAAEQSQAVWDNFRLIVATGLIAGERHTVDIPASGTGDYTIVHNLGRQPAGYLITGLKNIAILNELQMSDEGLVLSLALYNTGESGQLRLWVY